MPTETAKNEAAKGTDHVKFLAFKQLARDRVSPVDVRAILGISRATFYRYRKIHDKQAAARKHDGP